MIDRVRTRRIDDPVVLTGDFNAREEEAAMAFLRGELKLGSGDAAASNPIPFVDSFRFLHPDETAVGTYHAFRGIRVGPRIDYVFAGPGIRVHRARILRDTGPAGYPSDHYPVAATLRLP